MKKKNVYNENWDTINVSRTSWLGYWKEWQRNVYEFNNSDLRAIQLEGTGDMAEDRLHFNGRKREQDLISMNKYVGKQWLDMHQHSLNI